MPVAIPLVWPLLPDFIAILGAAVLALTAAAFTVAAIGFAGQIPGIGTLVVNAANAFVSGLRSWTDGWIRTASKPFIDAVTAATQAPWRFGLAITATIGALWGAIVATRAWVSSAVAMAITELEPRIALTEERIAELIRQEFMIDPPGSSPRLPDLLGFLRSNWLKLVSLINLVGNIATLAEINDLEGKLRQEAATRAYDDYQLRLQEQADAARLTQYIEAVQLATNATAAALQTAVTTTIPQTIVERITQLRQEIVGTAQPAPVNLTQLETELQVARDGINRLKTRVDTIEACDPCGWMEWFKPIVRNELEPLADGAVLAAVLAWVTAAIEAPEPTAQVTREIVAAPADLAYGAISAIAGAPRI